MVFLVCLPNTQSGVDDLTGTYDHTSDKRNLAAVTLMPGPILMDVSVLTCYEGVTSSSDSDCTEI